MFPHLSLEYNHIHTYKYDVVVTKVECVCRLTVIYTGILHDTSFYASVCCLTTVLAHTDTVGGLYVVDLVPVVFNLTKYLNEVES